MGFCVYRRSLYYYVWFPVNIRWKVSLDEIFPGVCMPLFVVSNVSCVPPHLFLGGDRGRKFISEGLVS